MVRKYKCVNAFDPLTQGETYTLGKAKGHPLLTNERTGKALKFYQWEITLAVQRGALVETTGPSSAAWDCPAGNSIVHRTPTGCIY